MSDGSNRIRIAVIGAGQNSQRNHLPVLKRLHDEGWCTLKVLCDLNSELAKKTAQTYGFEDYTHDAQTIFPREDVDAVYVFGTVQMHHTYGMAALQSNKHAFVEKPPLPDLATARSVAALAREKKKVFAVGFNRRFYQAIEETKKRTDGKTDIYSLEGVYHKPLLGETNMWGASSWLRYSSIHGIDAMCYLMSSLGRPVALYSANNSAEGTVPQNLSAMVTWANGAHAVLSSNNSGGPRAEHYMVHAYGVSYDSTESTFSVFTQDGREETAKYEEAREARGFYGEHKEFFQAIRGELTPRHGIDTVMPVLVLLELMEKGYCGKIDWDTLLGVSEQSTAHTPPSSSARLHATAEASTAIRGAVGGSILVLNPTVLRGMLPHMAQSHTLVFEEELPGMTEQARGAIKAIVTGQGGAPITEQMLEMLPHLSVVGIVGASVKKYNPVPVIEKGIPIINASDVYAAAVAEFALMQSLIGLKNASLSHDIMREGGWGVSATRGLQKYVSMMRKTLLKDAYRFLRPVTQTVWKRMKTAAPSITAPPTVPKAIGGRNVRGVSVGIIGYGAIAREFVRLLQPFGCNISIYSEYITDEQAARMGVQKATMARVLHADIVSLHRGLSERTRHSFGASEISMLKTGAILLNTSRGAIIDEAALIQRLKKGDIFACLDVFEEEPLPKNSPLRKLPNVFITSHLSGASKEIFDASPAAVVDKVQRYLAGEEIEHMITTKTMLENMT